jgi:alkanesulfonate monooxygenase SsuD/methylene tetrahydromethanopterin reductase-like flavin-dependent oxidoreductase (luciferase family)
MGDPPRLGILIGPDQWGRPGVFTSIINTVEAAHANGFEIFFGEHRARPDYAPSALSLAAIAIGAQRGLKVTTSAVIAGRRDPSSLLCDAEVLALGASERDGTFSLGIVAGYDRSDFDGTEFADRFLALDHALEAAKNRGWPWPLLVGASGPRGIRRAAEAGGLILPTRVTLEDAGQSIEEVRTIREASTVVLMRRWVHAATPEGLEEAVLRAGVRTPRSLIVGGGPRNVATAMQGLADIGADVIVYGPITSQLELAALMEDLKY